MKTLFDFFQPITPRVPSRAYMPPSERDDWQTPQVVWDWLQEQYGEDIYDPCPCGWQPGDPDGLMVDWMDTTYVNPPYSQNAQWMAKAYNEYKRGKRVVMLIPSRTDTTYWHSYAMKASDIWFVRGRLRFGLNNLPSKTGAPFASALIVFDHSTENETPAIHSLDLRGRST